MKNLLIIGARGFGREVFVLATECSGYGTDFIVKGFLDDKKDALDSYKDYPPIIGPVETYEIQPNDVFICALGDVKWKKHYSEIILKKGGKFISLVHPSTEIKKNVIIGKGCVISSHTIIGCDVTIGNHVDIQHFCSIGHDTTIGDWSMIDCYCFCGGFSKVGNECTMHTSSVLVPKRYLEDNVTINAGSIVIRDVPKNKTMMGNPAKELLIPKI